MSDENGRYLGRELRPVSFVTAVFAGVGWWFILHGGLSLLGLFGYERHLMEGRGEEVPTQAAMLREFALGVALFTVSLAGYLKVKLLRPRDDAM